MSGVPPPSPLAVRSVLSGAPPPRLSGVVAVSRAGCPAAPLSGVPPSRRAHCPGSLKRPHAGAYSDLGPPQRRHCRPCRREQCPAARLRATALVRVHLAAGGAMFSLLRAAGCGRNARVRPRACGMFSTCTLPTWREASSHTIVRSYSSTARARRSSQTSCTTS